MFTEARFPKRNSVEMRQNFCRQHFYFMKHYILFWNQNSKALKCLLHVFSTRSACLDRLQSWIVQNSLQTSYLVNWILAWFKGNKLISSIFCFHIDRKHRPSGSYLCRAICHVTWMPCWQMLTDLENLQACSGLACVIVFASVAASCKGKVRHSQEKSTYNTRWSQGKFCSLPGKK